MQADRKTRLLARPRALRSVVAAVSLLMGTAAPADEPALQFESEIAPLLEQHCVRCHGGEATEAGLNLSSAQSLLTGSDSGPVLQAGDPDGSLLLVRVEAGEMPPEDEPSLSPDEKELLRRWISEGAHFADPQLGRKSVDQHRIIPLMLLRCTACHGAQKQEGGLDLRTPESMLAGGDSGAVIVPGDPDASRLVQRIRAEEMPPRRQLVEASVKPMTPDELALLETWIRDGLPIAADEPPTAAGSPVSESDRAFWSFRSPVQPAPPEVPDAAQVRNPIDAFILSRLAEVGLTFSPAADRATLIRRAAIDLTGLPPDPDDVLEFLADDDPLAYERLIDRLLASPHYGSRWGRHWLDVAGYADSEGAQNEDRIRPHNWRYRDYVIQSFNADKPYDQFLIEQLAGDELADYEQAETIDEKLYDNLVATGFLRQTPDRTFASITNFVPDRLEVIADEMQVLGSAVMGMTLHCARCHAHKFDPISQRDYFQLLAVFKDGYDEHDWLASQGPRTLPHVTTAERNAWEQHKQQIDEQIAELNRQRESAADQSAQQSLDARIAELEAARRPEPRIEALWSRGRPSPTYVLMRGNYLTPGTPVEPAVPAVLADAERPFEVEPPWPGAAQTGRRLAFARWLTQPEHPLTARVIVNRVWRHHFGTGLVSTLDNFGRTGEPPSHPELLDWLAVEFVERGWSIKQLHRLIVTSTTYRQQSLVTEENADADPDGRLLSRMPLIRADAEVLRDSMLASAGLLEDRLYGPADPVVRREDGLVTPERSGGGWRRSVFILQRRTQTATLLDTFDFPQMGPNCTNRREAVVATQALHLLNNATVHQLAEGFAARVRDEAGDQPPAQIEQAYLIALSRAPSEDELQVGEEMLAQLTDQWQSVLQQDDAGTEVSRLAAERALASYCHALLNSAAFLYID